MRIVDRKTFLSLPAGTVFSKFAKQPSVPDAYAIDHGYISIKHETVADVDFRYVELFPPFLQSAEGDDQDVDVQIAMLKGDASPPLDYEVTTRDGLFDAAQLFAVWDHDDHLRLIRTLREAFDAAHGDRHLAFVTPGPK